MNVLMVEHLGRGGIAHYTHSLCTALSDKGVKVTLYTADEYEFSETARYQCYAGFPIRGWARKIARPHSISRVLKGLAFLWGMFRLSIRVSQQSPAVLHFQDSLMPSLEYLFLRYIRSHSTAGLVYTAHDILPPEPTPFDNYILIHLYELFDAVIVHAVTGAGEVRDLTSGAVDPYVIPLGSYDLFNAGSVERVGARQSLGYSEDDKVVLFFGVIRPYKGLDLLIQAFARVKRRIPGAKLLIVGNPKYGFELYEQLLLQHRLVKETKAVLGYIPNTAVPNYLMAADLVVLPYRHAYQSGSLQLAYAFGRPVIVTRVGGLPEVVEEGQSGLVVSPGNVGELADAIMQLLAKDDLRHEMGLYARQLAETKYSWNTIAESTVKVYKAILGA